MAIFLVSFKESFYLCHRKNSRIDWIGKLINFYEIPRQASLLNGGPRPSGGGLQRGRALKPCHSEFHHIIDAAFYKKEDGSSTVKNRPLFDLVYDRAITR